MKRKYYEAYDDRYRQVHQESVLWFSENPSTIVAETIEEYKIKPNRKLLELGCGEGRDAVHLLNRGFNLLATDISPTAIEFCKNRFPHVADHFDILDCVNGQWGDAFDFIYAVAVVHMLVLDADRNAFYQFIRNHLTETGIALICTMGDGHLERQSDIKTAFDLQHRLHEQSGKMIDIASTSCRIVSFETFEDELQRNGLAIIKKGLTSIEPDFTQIMYAVVRKTNV